MYVKYVFNLNIYSSLIYLQNILELCKLNDEIESLINCIKKELYASDEKRRIYMDSIRGRVHTSNMFTRNALQVWKKAALKSLARTNHSITTKLKEERITWKNDMVIKWHYSIHNQRIWMYRGRFRLIVRIKGARIVRSIHIMLEYM